MYNFSIKLSRMYLGLI
ncbi:hypothetical protein C923_00571 [Plasmodium falciparum UGT5.1]|uniref:Uncharacterized protein n=2 Tax=Plasmodium falciparum TaxID=5833 RepID=A0A024XDI2_PLAFC|nr:hypothetical protein PFMC_00507 [Plasmodium falciparum CAMP/Malaysia]EWC78802.1 hypothetical protein C923_00571 [Plasmodium falciparum UGT5.1]